MNETIEKCLNMKKVRYDYLDKLFKPYKNSLTEGELVKVFIDLPSTVKQLYNPEVLNGFSGKVNFEDKYLIASVLLNMIAHYRHYFASRWQCYTDIYFMNNSKMDTNLQQINKDYKKDYYEKRFSMSNPVFGSLNHILAYNYKMMKTIIPYIPDVYFLDSGSIDYRTIFPLIFKNNYDRLNIIITTDKMMYQNILCKTSFSKDTLILQPKAEKSNIVNYNNLIANCIDEKNKTIQNHPEYLSINPENIIIINSIINHKDYNITGIKNYSYLKALAFLNKNDIDVETMITNEKTIKDLFKGIVSQPELELILNNFKITNNYMLMERNEENLRLILESQFEDLDDVEGVRKVNEKYFDKFPLQTMYMWEGY